MSAAPSRPLLMLIDGSHAVFRAYHAIRGLTAPDGRPTGAIYGFCSMLLKLIDDHTPDKIVACFDAAGPGFRAEIDPAYKANRPPTPEDLKEQWPVVLRVTRELGLAVLDDPRLEADDLIATLAVRGRAAGMDVIIVSGDKDLMQLVVDPEGELGAVRQLDAGKNVLYDTAAVHKRWGVGPAQIGDLLAIMGDAVDNVPGVRGIGVKGAVALLQQLGDLDAIYARIDEIARPRTRKLLEQGQESARLSRRLVELVRDADLALSLDDMSPKEPDREALTATFTDLGFSVLRRRYLHVEEAAALPVETAICSDPKSLAAALKTLRAASAVGVDVVTSGDDLARRTPMLGALLGVALAADGERAFFVPNQQNLEGPVPAALSELLADPAVPKIGHDLKYTLVVLRRHGVRLQGLQLDPMLASYLLNPGARSHALETIALEGLSYRMASSEELLGKGKAKKRCEDVALESLARFAGERAALALRVSGSLSVAMRDKGVWELHRDLELPLSEVLADMERAGVALDTEALKQQSVELGAELRTLEASIHLHAGAPFNIKSPKQLGVVLFETLGLPAKKKTKSGWSTDQSVLDKLQGVHPIIDEIAAYRRLSKLKSTYTDALPTLVNPRTGRVHTSLNQAVAATGRLSSTDPNLQNIPIRTPQGRKIRQAFVAAPGHLVLSADYSQVELRVMAHLAQEPGMLQAFAEGMDIHRQTAALIFHVALEEVTASQRSMAKTINFGVLYGMGAGRLAAQIGVSRAEAKDFIARYFERFSGVKGFVDRTVETARETQEVRTLYGRLRALPQIRASNPMQRAAAERVAVNTPVQGTAADLIKRAMLIVFKRLDEAGLKARMVLQVHDELLLEVPEVEVEAVQTLVVQAMADAGELAVPLKVDVGVGTSWAEAH